ncbi:conjugal transfer protein MobC [Mucilaginibacter sp. UC70_90]
MQTGENEQALRKITDMTRLMAIVILFLHFYYQLYAAFSDWRFTSAFTDRLLDNIVRTGLFSNFYKAKLMALVCLCISLLGARGRKDERMNYKTTCAYIVTGLLFYGFSFLVLYTGWGTESKAILYMAVTSIGFLLILSGGTLLSRIIKNNLSNDIFNSENETFPQEERLLINEYSINLPATYTLKGKTRRSYVNIVTPQASCIIQGRPGAGKTAYCVRQFITQALGKEAPYTMFIYDFKFPDLTVVAYNHWLKNKHRYKAKPGFYFINYDDLSRSHRCNPLDPMCMTDITDASESARTILLGLNREFEKKSGDFFVESALNFITALIWFLRQYDHGAYCTLPHVIELMAVPYDQLFTVLKLEPEIDAYIGDFINAFLEGATDQLAGQVASAKVSMARLSSPNLYYVLSGSDFTLDVNNPDAPKVVCLGSNPQKILTYGAVNSLYLNRMLKIMNQEGKEKSMGILEEFPTLSADVIPTITTGRSNKIATCLVIQDSSQLKKEYGKDKADVILTTVGSVIAGQVAGESARQLSERIGKIMQDRQSLSINSQDTSVSKSKQLESAVPASTISTLSSGEFVGVVADTPDQQIKNKAFHCRIDADFEAMNEERKGFKAIPVVRQVSSSMVQANYQQIKRDIQELVSAELERLHNDPALQHLIVKKK